VTTHDDTLYLLDMLQRARRIRAHTGGERRRLFEEQIVEDAIIRNFEVVGEAATKISVELRAAHPEIPWRKIIGFRNVLIHAYSDLQLERVWDAIKHDLPDLIAALETILRARGIDPDRIPE
jgi:uncharacterized protein with HEPN domain